VPAAARKYACRQGRHDGAVFWNYDPASLRQQPRDEIDVHLGVQLPKDGSTDLKFADGLKMMH
jgi:hypothetical protein